MKNFKTLFTIANSYLLMAVIGTIVPLYHGLQFFIDNGLNWNLFFEQLFAYPVSRFFAADLLISWFVFLFWSYKDSQKNAIQRWWVVALFNCMVGLSLALPYYLYLREKKMAFKS